MNNNTKRSTLLFLLTMALTANHASYAESDSAARLVQKRPVAAFSAIELNGPYHVIIQAQGERALEVSGEAKQLENIDTTIEGDTLIVRPRQRLRFVFGLGKSHDEVTVRINAPGLKSLKNSGSGDVQLSQLQSGPLTLSLNGSGDVAASGNISELTYKNHGSGDADLHLLKIASVNGQMSGSGNLHLGDVSQEVELEMNGSGDLLAPALRTARVSLRMRGSGDARLGGSSKDLRAELSGSGDLQARDLAVSRATTHTRGSSTVQLNKIDESLDAEINGSGDLSATLAAKRVQLVMSGSGDVKLSGTVGTLSAKLSGSGELEARDLMANQAEVNVRGSGEAVVNVRAKPGATGVSNGVSRLVRVDRSGAKQME